MEKMSNKLRVTDEKSKRHNIGGGKKWIDEEEIWIKEITKENRMDRHVFF